MSLLFLEEGKGFSRHLSQEECSKYCIEVINVGRMDARLGKDELQYGRRDVYRVNGVTDEDMSFIDNIYECYKLGYQLGKFEYGQHQVKKAENFDSPKFFLNSLLINE